MTADIFFFFPALTAFPLIIYGGKNEILSRNIIEWLSVSPGDDR